MKKITKTFILSLLFIGISCSSDDSTSNENVTPPSENPSTENPPTQEPTPSDAIVGNWTQENYKYYKNGELVLNYSGECSTIKDEWIFKNDNTISLKYHNADCVSSVYDNTGTWSKTDGVYTIAGDGDPYEILELNSTKIELKYDGGGTFYPTDESLSGIHFDYYTIELKK